MANDFNSKSRSIRCLILVCDGLDVAGGNNYPLLPIADAPANISFKRFVFCLDESTDPPIFPFRTHIYRVGRVPGSCNMLEILLPDGTIVSHPDDATPLSVAEKIGSRLAKAVIAAKIGDLIVDASRPLRFFASNKPIPLRLLTEKDPEALDVLRHSSAHVMARAIMRLYPNVSLAFGPTISNGFYYDFDLPQKLNEDDFAKIEAEMAKIVELAEPFEQFSLNREQSIELCKDMKQTLKVDHIGTGLAAHESLGFYRQGEFVDLCRGPHIPDAGRIKAPARLPVPPRQANGR